MDSNCLAAMVFDGGYSVTTSRTVSFEIVVSCMSGCGKSSPNYCGKIQIFRVASSIKSSKKPPASTIPHSPSFLLYYCTYCTKTARARNGYLSLLTL